MKDYPRKGAWCVINDPKSGVNGELGIVADLNGDTAEVHLVHVETGRNKVHGETSDKVTDVPVTSTRIATYDEIKAVCKARRSPLTKEKAASMGYL